MTAVKFNSNPSKYNQSINQPIRTIPHDQQPTQLLCSFTKGGGGE